MDDMNDRTHVTDTTVPTGPTTEEHRLQALDLGALGIAGAADQAVACDINDPDCEMPEAVTSRISTATGEDEA
ncbi:MAG: hypothetical protein DWG82_02385 [Chloroflexi bacterium]|nr:hypothetical protein [Chloroflexota bacterium]